MNKRLILSLFFVVCVALGIMPMAGSASATASACAVQQENEPWMTVFVHGIISVKPHLSVPNIFKFIRDTVEDTVYYDTVGLMRQDPFFYKAQAMQELGLVAVDPQRVEQGYASGLLAASFESSLAHVGRGSTTNNHRYYTFGWNGILSQSHRYAEARRLYDAIEQESRRLEAELGCKPRVRLVAYSHGGNVCLNLAAVRVKEKRDLAVMVDELILVGVPIQVETDHYVADPLFKVAYHIYSRDDRIQKMDCFSFNRFFSRRIFDNRPSFKVPEKLTQIQVRFTRHSVLCHDEDRYAALLRDFRNPKVLSGRAHSLRGLAPGHTELWFFGWTTQSYRPTMPIAPFPIATFAPLLTNAARDFKEKGLLHAPHKPVIVDVRVAEEMMIVRNQQSLDDVLLVPFMSAEHMKTLRASALAYSPEGYTHDAYEQHSDDAYQKAREINHKGREEQNFYRRSLKKRKQKAAREARIAFWNNWFGRLSSIIA